MNFTVRVTKKVIGELILPACKDRMFKSGQLISLSEEEFNNQYTQMALRQEKIVLQQSTGEVNEEVLKSEKKTAKSVKKSSIKKSSIRKSSKKEDKSKSEDDSLMIDLNDVEKDPLPNMQTWNAYEQRSLDREESEDQARKQHNGINMDVQQSGEEDIDFDEVNKKMSEMQAEIEKKTASVSKKKKKATKASKKKKKGTKVSKKKLEEDKNSVGFVDVEQINEAINSHPILREKNSESSLFQEK